jgi:hypothetical protein
MNPEEPGKELSLEKADNVQYLAYQIRYALNPPQLFGVTFHADPKLVEQIIARIAKAYKEYDFEFLLYQADGLKKLKDFNPIVSPNNPTWFLYRAYNFLRHRNDGKPPFRTQTIELTKRLWAITRMTQLIPELPLPAYDEDFEHKILLGIADLPVQKWSRPIRKLGLVFTPAKRGPKAGKRERKS